MLYPVQYVYSYIKESPRTLVRWLVSRHAAAGSYVPATHRTLRHTRVTLERVFLLTDRGRAVSSAATLTGDARASTLVRRLSGNASLG